MEENEFRCKTKDCPFFYANDETKLCWWCDRDCEIIFHTEWEYMIIDKVIYG